MEGDVLLSYREVEVLELLAAGRKREEIADVLCIEESTVKSHQERLYKKLQVHSKADLLVKAFRGGWIS